MHFVKVANCAANVTAGASDQQPTVSVTVYNSLLMLLSAVNVLLNSACLKILPSVMPRRSPAYPMLICLSLAEILFNASAFAMQKLVYDYGYRRGQFASIRHGLAIGAAMQTALLLQQTMHRFRNWTVVLLAWSQFGRLFPACRKCHGVGSGGWRTGCALCVNLVLSLAVSAPKVFESVAIVCAGNLRLSQESTRMSQSLFYQYAYMYAISYLSSTVGPVVTIAVLYCCVLRSLASARRRQQQQQQPQPQPPPRTHNQVELEGDAEVVEQPRPQPHTAAATSAAPASQYGDVLIVTLVAAFCVCELPALVAALMHFKLRAGGGASVAAATAVHHMVHLAHLGTALDSTLNILVYIFPYRRLAIRCRKRREARDEERHARVLLAMRQLPSENHSPTRGFTTVGQSNNYSEFYQHQQQQHHLRDSNDSSS